MAKQGRWILKNVRHNKPGVTIQSASLKLQGKTIDLGTITTDVSENISTDLFTDLGTGLDLSSVIKSPAEGSTFTQNGIKYRVHWVLTQKPQPEPEPEIGDIVVSPASLTVECEPDGTPAFIVTAPEGVAWTAETTSNWITINITENGFTLTISNNGGNQREAVITVKPRVTGAANPATVRITQLKCAEVPIDDITVNPHSLTVECDDNTTHVITVTAPEGVAWTASTEYEWIAIEINGNEISLTFTNNDGNTRSGTVSVYPVVEGTANSTSISVTQKKCDEIPIGDITVNLDSLTINCEDSGSHVVTVTAPEGVAWTADTESDWITIEIDENSVILTFSDNDGEERTGTISVYPVVEGAANSTTITVTQAKCEEIPEIGDIVVDPSSLTIDCDDNTTHIITVNAPEGIAWTADTESDWITIEVSENQISLTFANNDGNNRSGTISVYPVVEGTANSTTITITQKKCDEIPIGDITVDPDSLTVDCEPDVPLTVTVTVPEGVEWTATTDDEWIGIEIDGNEINLTFDKNGYSERTGTISVYPQTEGAANPTSVTVTQEACLEPENLTIKTDNFSVSCDDEETHEISVESNGTWTAETIETWIHITGINETTIFVVFDKNNEDGDRSGIISAYTTGSDTRVWDSIEITQLECEVEQWTFEVNDDDLRFECFPSDAQEVEITASENVEWTATTSSGRFKIYLAGEVLSTTATGTGSATLFVKPTMTNTNVRYDIEETLTIRSNFGDEIEIALYQAPTPILSLDSPSPNLSFDSTGETKFIDLVTNFPVIVSIPQADAAWLSYSVGNLGTDADDGLRVQFTASSNGPAQRGTTAIISLDYNGECDVPNSIVINISQEAKYEPPIPGAKFEVTDIFADYPYYAELGGFSHEYSFMSEDFYNSCGLSNGDVGGVVYLMPVHSCAIQVYYDTNVDLSNLTYEIVHVSPQNPEQEWLEVLMDPSKYRCLEEYPEMECGWSDVDSRDEPYPGEFILIKTRDSFEGSHLYDDEYTGYVKIKVASTGQVLRTIPVKCIGVDINSESVEVSDSANGNKKSRITIGSDDNPAVGPAGGFVDLWVYTNDSAYFSDHPDNDVSWNGLTFYYEDGTTIIPVIGTQDPAQMGYIDKICDTRCNNNEFMHIKVKVDPNCQNTNIEKGFELSTENAGYLILDSGNRAKVKIVQARNRVSESNYRIEEFYVVNNEMTPVWGGDHQYGEYKYITGATCDGNGHTITPSIKVLYDESELCNPGVLTPQEPLNDDRVIYDETQQHNIANPTVIEASIQYLDDTGWISQNGNYNAQTGQPFEFYIKPYTGYTDNEGAERSAIITVTYKNCAPQQTRQLRITQSYMKVEPEVLPVQLYVLDIHGDRIGDDTEATVTPSGSTSGFAFEIINGSNVQATLRVTNGKIPGVDYYPWLEEDVVSFSSATKVFGTTGTPMTMGDSTLIYQVGIPYPDSGISNMSRYNVYTKGHAFDLHLICESISDPMVKKEMIIHVQ